MGDCPGPRKETATRQNVTQGVVVRNFSQFRISLQFATISRSFLQFCRNCFCAATKPPAASRSTTSARGRHRAPTNTRGGQAGAISRNFSHLDLMLPHRNLRPPFVLDRAWGCTSSWMHENHHHHFSDSTPGTSATPCPPGAFVSQWIGPLGLHCDSRPAGQATTRVGGGLVCPFGCCWWLQCAAPTACPERRALALPLSQTRLECVCCAPWCPPNM